MRDLESPHRLPEGASPAPETPGLRALGILAPPCLLPEGKLLQKPLQRGPWPGVFPTPTAGFACTIRPRRLTPERWSPERPARDRAKGILKYLQSAPEMDDSTLNSMRRLLPPCTSESHRLIVRTGLCTITHFQEEPAP